MKLFLLVGIEFRKLGATRRRVYCSWTRTPIVVECIGIQRNEMGSRFSDGHFVVAFFFRPRTTRCGGPK